MQKSFLKLGAFLGALSVILGAFGAHALKQILTEKGLATFETGVRYQMYHAFAIILTGILYKEFSNKFLLSAGRLFFAGVLIFSGSLYFLRYTSSIGADSLKWIGAITPLGGVCFIAGWLLLAFGISKKN